MSLTRILRILTRILFGGGCGTAIAGGDTSSSGGDDNNGIEGNVNVTLPFVNVTIGGSETTYYPNGNINRILRITVQ